MKVRILTILHGIFDVEVEQQEKVATLKTKISQQKGYSVSQIRLIYSGRVLKDDETIQQINLKDTSFVILLMKINSSGKTYLTEKEVNDIKMQKEAEKQRKEAQERMQNQPLQPLNLHQPAPQPVAQPPPRLPTINEIPADPEAMQILMEAGFSEIRAKKALLLNNMDVEAAMEWILTNLDNPTVDAPLTLQELQQIAASFQEAQYLERNQNKPIRQDILQAIEKKVCTFCVTGREFAHQKWYFCETCGLTDSKGCCESCAQVCHAGHQLSEVKTSTFFCDCGAGEGRNPCQCLHYDRVNAMDQQPDHT